MLSRREFISRGTTILLLVPMTARCGSGSTTSSSPPGPTPPGSCVGVSTTSSVNDNHTHTLCVGTADLTNPPSGGMTYTSSSTSSHAHMVTLSAAQLSAINAGTQVTIVSSIVPDPLDGVDHAHSFALVMVPANNVGAVEATQT